MKKFVLSMLAILFLTNTVVVSAWAKPCVTGLDTEAQTAISTSMSDEMPCHGEKEQKQSQDQHCDGMCLCIHVSLAPTLIDTETPNLNFPSQQKGQVLSPANSLTSLVILPLLRPPKSLS